MRVLINTIHQLLHNGCRTNAHALVFAVRIKHDAALCTFEQAKTRARSARACSRAECVVQPVLQQQQHGSRVDAPEYGVAYFSRPIPLALFAPTEPHTESQQLTTNAPRPATT